MRSPSHFQMLLLCILFTTSIYAQEASKDTTERAEYALSKLQSWYNASTGVWNTAGWWNAANIMTTVGNLAKANPQNPQLHDLATSVFANTLIKAPSKNPQPRIEKEIRGQTDGGNSTFSHLNTTGYKKIINPSNYEPHTCYPSDWHNLESYNDFANPPIYKTEDRGGSQKSIATSLDPEDWLDGYYDDDLWWALAWINAFDITGNTSYLTLAEGIFAAVSKAWPTRCFNGGIFWSWEKKYMNAIANELFMSTAAHLANRVSEVKKCGYVDWAHRTLVWFLKSGMMNPQGTINDGLTQDCQNNQKTTWSYNQGVILGALVELNSATPDPSYLVLATRIAKAALLHLSDNHGVLHDFCEPDCGEDGSQFKGIFMRNLQALHAVAPDAVYVEAATRNAESIWEKDRGEDMGVVFGVNWAGPYRGPANATMQSSALDALVAGIVLQ